MVGWGGKKGQGAGGGRITARAGHVAYPGITSALALTWAGRSGDSAPVISPYLSGRAPVHLTHLPGPRTHAHTHTHTCSIPYPFVYLFTSLTICLCILFFPPFLSFFSIYLHPFIYLPIVSYPVSVFLYLNFLLPLRLFPFLPILFRFLLCVCVFVLTSSAECLLICVLTPH